MSPGPTVHLVDDEAPVRDALTFLLRSHGLTVGSYASGPEFLKHLPVQSARGCIVLDVRMEPMSGLQVFDELLLRKVSLPVLFLSGHGDIPMVVDALQKGAVDFLEKPFSGDHLVQRVQRALEMEAEHYAATEARAHILRCLRALTSRERAVMRLVAAGKLNKVIAYELCIAVRTVEAHRSRVFEKLGLRSAAELATLLAGFPEFPAED
ncbi:MAG: DNA-binding response regulator [Burkholderiales bacterium PBB4]|nr:MAG: DNA-binding response regulator [Burkholderiales bacterium PBB4]